MRGLPAIRPGPARRPRSAEGRSGSPLTALRLCSFRAAVVVLAASAAGCYLFHGGATERLVYSESALSPPEIAARAAEVDSLYRSPRTAERVEKAFRIALDSISPSNGYVGLWQAARAASWLADNLSESDRREHFARKGIAAAREAVRLASGRVEPYYYLAMNLGQLSDVLRSPRFVTEMAENAEIALVKDERYDRAGPDRFLGLLNLEAEGHRLITGYGDLDKALAHLSRAVELFPEDGENRLAYARALAADEDPEAALRELKAALATKPPPDLEAEHADWLRKARELAAEIQGK